MKLNPFRFFMFVMLLVVSKVLFAEQKEVFDGPDGSEYEVHYIAFASTFLEPDVARQYDLVRSKALGVINISVIKVDPDGKREAIGTVVEGLMTNDIQQKHHMAFRQITEGKSIYYLSQIQYRQGEVLTFDIATYPQGLRDPLRLRFTQTFYND